MGEIVSLSKETKHRRRLLQEISDGSSRQRSYIKYFTLRSRIVNLSSGADYGMQTTVAVSELTLLVCTSCGPHPSSPAAKAAFKGNDERVRALIASGADPNGAESPLILASRAGHATVIRILLQAGADPNQRGGSTTGQ